MMTRKGLQASLIDALEAGRANTKAISSVVRSKVTTDKYAKILETAYAKDIERFDKLIIELTLG